MAMHSKSDRKTRGRTTITGKSNTHPHVENTRMTQASRPVTAGTGKHRGDRRDMSKVYTNSAKHSARGSDPRRDTSTRKR